MNSSLLSGRSGLAVLIDPDRISAANAWELARRAAGEGAALLLLGNSFGPAGEGGALAARLKRAAPELPLVQFPAMALKLDAGVDAVLLLSLVSGRNAQYLIEEHVRAVPFFAAHPNVQAISTAYCLVDGGHVTSVESVSQTRPLPSDKPELAAAHLHAAALIGMHAAYLDAGSGASRAISPLLIRAARAAWSGPLLVGGGIRGAEKVRMARDAGADLVVVGGALEADGPRVVRELALAARA
jgi:phosphoglycerol geranylgeranyltransferase